MNFWLVVCTSFSYLLLLFWIAYFGDLRAKKGKSLVANPYAYALSLTVFCTTWTYFGSIGKAANEGITFFTTYLGPALILPLWWLVMRKIIRICKKKHITNIADFISSRYGKSMSLGILVSIICVFGLIPYLSLQLKAITDSFIFITQQSGNSTTPSYFWEDYAFYISISLAFFNILFGTRNVEATEQHQGMISVIVFESILKLFSFLLIGILVSFFIFDGVGDIFRKAQEIEKLKTLFVLENQSGYSSWFLLSILSMLAFMFLPRQFQVAVVENIDEKHTNRAMWFFPLYLFLINIFVLPIAFGGKILFGNEINPDTFLVSIPLLLGYEELSLLAYLGGFSAGTSMVIVEVMALNVMISNNIVMPLLVSIPSLQNNSAKLRDFLIHIRRISIIFIILLAYLYYKWLANNASLVSIGLISFVAIAQLAPAMIGAIFWKQANKIGAFLGLLVGFLLWGYLLVIPNIAESDWYFQTLVREGIGGIEMLKPDTFLGLAGLDNVSKAFFWTLLFNTGIYVFCGLYFKQSIEENRQANEFVDVFLQTTLLYHETKKTADMSEIRTLLENFLGTHRTKELFDFYFKTQDWNKIQTVDANFIEFTEKILAGTIGSASAQILISSIILEETIGKNEVFAILKESQQIILLNQELQLKSNELEKIGNELQNANEELKKKDILKNDFISTITHELRTPITAIRAFSEILSDNTDLDEEEKHHFLQTILKETNRMERLINQVLDLERYDSGKYTLAISSLSINELIKEAVDSVHQLISEKKIDLQLTLDKTLPLILADKDRIIQVLLNLLSNAIKFCHPTEGIIHIQTSLTHQGIQVSIQDNGKGVPKALQELIFEKFYQAEDQNIKKPKGSGLGLAICKKIIQSHNGDIWVESSETSFTNFLFYLPLIAKTKS